MALDTGWRRVSARLVKGNETVAVLCKNCHKISVKLREGILKNITQTCDHCATTLIISEDDETQLKRSQL